MWDQIKLAFESGLELWGKGGWAMIPLGINALILYAKAAHIHICLLGKGYRDPKKTGDAGVDYAMAYLDRRGIHIPASGGLAGDLAAFNELRAQELPPIDRDLRLMKAAMSAAPLWGLLGTVTGMLKTFAGLSEGSGGDETMGSISSGISEALVTTQTGLMIAIPGYLLYYYLAGQRNRLGGFLTTLETTTAKAHHFGTA